MIAEDIKKLVEQKAAIDPRLRSIVRRMESGTATFKETSEYSRIFSEIVGNTLSEHVLSLEDREAVANELLRYGYENINSILAKVQADIDKKNRVNIRPQKASFPQERAEQFSHSLTDPTVPDETIERRANNGTANITMSFHDDYMRENAEFRSNAGLRCYIERQTNGKCCAWCSDIAGRYDYGNEPQDVYRRHDNCDCTVTYENGRQRQDVWSKRSWEAPKNGLKYTKPTVISRSEARRLNEEKGRVFIHNSSDSAINISLSDDKSQYYRPVLLNSDDKVTLNRNYSFTAFKAETTSNNIYVSENVNLKPKKLHQIDAKISEALDLIGISNRENLPNVIIVSREDMVKNDVAIYRAIENVMLICEDFAVYKPQDMPSVMEQLACGENDLSSYVHELYHWVDAEEFRNKYGEVTDPKYTEYENYINNKAMKKLDNLSAKGYNVLVSDYAIKNVELHRYYEILTEYRTYNLLEGE